MLFMKRDLVAFNQRKKILRRVTRQSAFAKMGIVRQKILRPSVQVRKVATSTTGDTDFFCQLFGMINQHDAQAALTSGGGTHHACGTSADNRDVKFLHLFSHEIFRVDLMVDLSQPKTQY